MSDAVAAPRRESRAQGALRVGATGLIVVPPLAMLQARRGTAETESWPVGERANRVHHRSAAASEAVDRVEQLLALARRLAAVARGERVADAVVDVLVEELEGDSLERGGDGRDLGQDVDAVAVVGDHLLDAAHLPLDAMEALDQRVF